MSSSELNSFLREVASQEREEEVGRVLGKALKLDPFDVLQIPPTASAAEATKAFRRISLLVHPDKVGAELRESARKVRPGRGCCGSARCRLSPSCGSRKLLFVPCSPTPSSVLSH